MICGTASIYASRSSDRNAPKRDPSDRKAQLQAELSALSSWQEKSRFLDEKLALTNQALRARNENLLALRPDFADLEQDFWRVFARGLGCENAAHTIATDRGRLRLGIRLLILVAGLGVLFVLLCPWAGNASLAVGIWIVPLLLVAMVILPMLRLAQAKRVAAILARQQEPIWLTGGSIGLSSQGTTWPEGAKWWWKDRTALVFTRHIATQFSLDALSLEPLWNEPLVLPRDPELPATRAAEILRHLIDANPRYRDLVNSFRSLAALDTDYTALVSLGAEVKQNLAAELRTAQKSVPRVEQAAQGGSGASESSSPPPPESPEVQELSWNDLIVSDELLEKLQTYCDILRQAQAFKQRGVTIPKGLLLCGPPGTGKTQTARVLAAQSGLAFVGCTTADIKQGWLGHSGQKVKEIFASARASAPTILFIDELEAITNDVSSSPDTIVAELTAQLLQEIDGIQAHPQAVFLVGATNQPERINRALFNRFTEKIQYPLPSFEQRKRLLDLLITHRPLAEGMSRTELLEHLARASDGASGRDLRTMVERATIHAISRSRALGHPLEFAISVEDFQSELENEPE
jgi:AAA+ superfamily predicted ATPase